MKMKRLVALLLAVLLTLPAALAMAGDEFENEDGFVYVLDMDGAAEIVGYTGKAKTLKIPSEIDGHPVTAIGARVFHGNESLTEVKISAGVTAIRREAFYLCSSLVTLKLPEGLVLLEEHAIGGCDKLKNVNLPDSVTEAGDGLFEACRALEKVKVSADHPYFSVVDGVLFSKPDHRLIWYPRTRKDKVYTVPQGTEIIGQNAFYKTALTQAVIPESVTEIHSAAFSDSSKLQKVNVPSGVTELNGAFANCSALKQINVSADNPVLESHNGVLFQKIEKELVYYPAGRKDKTYAIPDGTLSIGENAFSGSQLSGVSIPGSIKEIKSNAFLFCRLKKVTVPEGVERIRGLAFQGCDLMTEISLPRSLVSVGTNPFFSCRNLKKVKLAADHPTLGIRNGALISKENQQLIWYPQTTKAKKYTVPKGVRIIGELAFDGCTQLTEVIIPEGVEEIMHSAFTGCSKIKSFTLPASLKNADPSAFRKYVGSQTMIGATYTVPRGSYAENYCKSFKLKTKVK